MPATSQYNHQLQIYSLSEQAVTIEFGHEMSEDLLQVITNFHLLISQNPFPGFYTAVPAYTTLSVFFDPVKVIQSPELTGRDCFEKVSGYLSLLKERLKHTPPTQSDTISIPVCYGGEFGPDINDIANLHNLTVDEVIRLHSFTEYKVYMIGFVPGFAYLGGLIDLLESPRKATPRSAVPAGAVGIAGKQTGVYPLKTPGGWQIIGQTPVKMFDATRSQPSLLKAGDRVVFEPIEISEFNRLATK
jgi:inhibitor of KinA